MIDIGSVVNGKYRLVRILGDGGMGSVYEALHAVLGTRVAIKVLHPELVRRTGLVERFLQEARVVAQIGAPTSCRSSTSTARRTATRTSSWSSSRASPSRASSTASAGSRVGTACEYTVQILEALEAAHALGVVHRDLEARERVRDVRGGPAGPQAHRLRDREGAAARSPPEEPDRRGRRDGHGGVHGARAGAQRGHGRSARGPLRRRRHALRDDRGSAAGARRYGRGRARHRPQGRARRGDPARAGGARDAARPRGPRASRDGGAPGDAVLPRRPRCASRSRAR